MLDVPKYLLEERRRLGHDVRDEMWEGVLHMVPPPSGRHQRLNAELVAVMVPLARGRRLLVLTEAGIFRPGAVERDYRVPDLVVARPEHYWPELGIVGAAELVVELRSPGDETYEKLPFYAGLGCRQVLVIDPETGEVELFEYVEGELQRTTTPSLMLHALELTVATADDPLRLLLASPDGSAAIPLD
jgi:Uma2 family endonuclease